MQRSLLISLIVLTGLSSIDAEAAEPSATAPAERRLYAVGEAARDRGTIAVYDIDARHRLIKTIRTVPNVADVKGAAASGSTGKLYVAYRDGSGTGMIYCIDLYDDRILWDRAVGPAVDRLAISPGGQLLYVPTWEGGNSDYINVVDANTGDVVRRVYFSNRSHDAQYPLSGPLFQETKADDGSGDYLYLVDPRSYAVSRIGPYSGILGPYAVDGTSTTVVNDVTQLWGMQIADLKTGRIVTASLPHHPPGNAGLMHGIGWTPDQTEVWQSSSGSDPHVYIWDMSDPMKPRPKDTLTLRSGRGSHWLTFDVKGDYGYVAPEKNSADGTEIFDAHSHAYVGTIGSSEDMLEVDFINGRITEIGDQYGIGRRPDRR
jgi:hypothetical protein